MKLLFVLDDDDYQGRSNIFRRYAVRAVIKRNNKLLLIKSALHGDCKFIGGGIEINESHIEALKREAKEEGGITLTDSFIPLGYVIEQRASIYDENEIFYMESFYYLCEVEHFGENDLQGYEIEFDYKLIELNPLSAIENNRTIAFTWTKRDTKILELILNHEIKI